MDRAVVWIAVIAYYWLENRDVIPLTRVNSVLRQALNEVYTFPDGDSIFGEDDVPFDEESPKDQGGEAGRVFSDVAGEDQDVLFAVEQRGEECDDGVVFV